MKLDPNALASPHFGSVMLCGEDDREVAEL